MPCLTTAHNHTARLIRDSMTTTTVVITNATSCTPIHETFFAPTSASWGCFPTVGYRLSAYEYHFYRNSPLVFTNLRAWFMLDVLHVARLLLACFNRCNRTPPVYPQRYEFQVEATVQLKTFSKERTTRGALTAHLALRRGVQRRSLLASKNQNERHLQNDTESCRTTQHNSISPLSATGHLAWHVQGIPLLVLISGRLWLTLPV